jgi:toxin ParE1/3/4
MRLVYLPSAEEDALEIFVTIALDNEPAAHRFIERLKKAIGRLADFPESAPARDDLRPGLRGLLFAGYIALYRIAGWRRSTPHSGIWARKVLCGGKPCIPAAA